MDMTYALLIILIVAALLFMGDRALGHSGI